MLAIAVVTVLLGAQGFATVSAPAVSAGDGTPVTTVSLTWDDGRASQVGTIALHEQRGLRATYYVSSDLIGSSAYYLDRPTLDRVHAAGNEIGGHGDRHIDLTTVDLATAQTLVCGDRDRQTVWYPDAGRSFAYPFGSFNADLERIVADCGYQSARAVGGVRTATSCSNCPLAESIPPSDPFALITTSSVRSTTTLDDLKALVEQGTGGWVLPIFHDLGVGGTYSVSVAVYAAFLDWLTTRPATVVRTVADVLSGEPPPTSTTSTSSTSTTPSSTSTSSTSTTSTTVPSPGSITNAGLESDVDRDRVPDCWSTVDGVGNRVSWSRTSGHTGRWGEQAVVRRWSAGDVVLLSDTSCAPVVAAGTVDLGVWYSANAPVWFVVEGRTSTGSWTTLAPAESFPSTRSWTRALRRVVVPEGFTSLRFGLALRSTGQIVTDDYSLVRIAP